VVVDEAAVIFLEVLIEDDIPLYPFSHSRHLLSSAVILHQEKFVRAKVKAIPM
jgi:hypothetical protein